MTPVISAPALFAGALATFAADRTMISWAVNLLALGLGVTLTTALLPASSWLARRLRAVDTPDGVRRLHHREIPRLGGVALFIGVVASVSIAYLLLARFAPEAAWTPFGESTLPIAAGALLVFLTGLTDDVSGVSPLTKLLLQTVAALLVVGAGYSVDAIAVASDAPLLSLGMVGAPITVLWIVGVTNAFNLIDGLDGLAFTCALVGLSAVTTASAFVHGSDTFVISLALVGALLAFARTNWHPARVFMGDSGSMTIGFFLAVRSIAAGTDSDGTLYALVPLVALGYPLLDTGTAMLRRLLRGHPISQADGRHIHHRLMALGLRTPSAVVVIGGAGAALVVAGLSVSFAPPPITLALGLAFAAFTAVLLVSVVSWLGYGEFHAFGESLLSVLYKARTVVQHRIHCREVAARIGPSLTLTEVHRELRALADRRYVQRVELVPASSHASTSPAESWSDDVDGGHEVVAAPSGGADTPGADGALEIPSAGAALLSFTVCRTPAVWTLRIWCTLEGLEYHMGDRIAATLGDALEAWARVQQPATEQRALPPGSADRTLA